MKDFTLTPPNRPFREIMEECIEDELMKEFYNNDPVKQRILAAIERGKVRAWEQSAPPDLDTL